MDPHHHPGLLHLVQLCLTDKIAAVHKGDTKALPVILRGGPVAEDHRRIVVMAGNAPLALHRLDAVMKGLTLRKPLHGMPSVKMDHVHGTPGKVQLRGHYPAQGDGSFPSVYHFHRPGDDVAVPDHTVKQFHADSA